MNGNFGRLKLFVERELFFRENSGQLDGGALNSEEIVDEAVARALDDSIEKPDRMGLEPWLYRLAIRAMDDLEAGLSGEESDVHLQGLRQRRNERASDEAALQFHQPDEAMTTESGIADSRISTPEEIAYSDEMITLVQFALKAASRQDREAFILYAIEGFSMEEIGAITDRKPEQVEQSVRGAREKLRQAFPYDPAFKARAFKDRMPQFIATD